MDRRNRSRVDLQLSCRIDGRKFVSEESGDTTENISRNGLLLRWTRSTPVPSIGTVLRVEVELPTSGQFAPRLIQCESTVVRVLAGTDGSVRVGLKVDAMRFVEDPLRLCLGDLNAAGRIQETVN
jgi:c-di-GMP-binding flagellar brake protein YcgR